MIDTIKIVAVGGSRRHRSESRFRVYGMLAIGISLAFLILMIGAIAFRGIPAFKQYFIQIEISLPADKIDMENLQQARFGKLVKSGLQEMFPEAITRKDKKLLSKLISSNAEYTVRDKVFENQ